MLDSAMVRATSPQSWAMARWRWKPAWMRSGELECLSRENKVRNSYYIHTGVDKGIHPSKVVIHTVGYLR